MDESKELEREAIALWKKHKYLLGAVKPFLLRLASFLNWQELKGAMK